MQRFASLARLFRNVSFSCVILVVLSGNFVAVAEFEFARFTTYNPTSATPSSASQNPTLHKVTKCLQPHHTVGVHPLQAATTHHLRIFFPAANCGRLQRISEEIHHAGKYLPWSRILFHHTGIFKHVCPLSTGSCMTVLQVLSKVVRPVELFGRVALSELVHFLQMFDTLFPILVGSMSRRVSAVECATSWATPRTLKLVSAIAAGVGFAWSIGRVVESTVVTREC